jgi:hypothetical protein
MTAAPPPKVLIATLWHRRSARGNDYLSGYLGKAKVIGFRGETMPDGIQTWNIFLQPGKEQETAEAERKTASPRRSEQPQRQHARAAPRATAAAEPDRPFFDDGIDDIGRDG